MTESCCQCHTTGSDAQLLGIADSAVLQKQICLRQGPGTMRALVPFFFRTLEMQIRAVCRRPRQANVELANVNAAKSLPPKAHRQNLAVTGSPPQIRDRDGRLRLPSFPLRWHGPLRSWPGWRSLQSQSPFRSQRWPTLQCTGPSACAATHWQLCGV